jgi:Adenylate and Guanylate cyclase catalytic domain
VIGRRKFIYDLWGDTVNTASRMESHGLPGSIQVTERTYRRLRDRYDFTERGTVQVKGKGDIVLADGGASLSSGLRVLLATRLRAEEAGRDHGGLPRLHRAGEADPDFVPNEHQAF